MRARICTLDKESVLRANSTAQHDGTAQRRCTGIRQERANQVEVAEAEITPRAQLLYVLAYSYGTAAAHT